MKIDFYQNEFGHFIKDFQVGQKFKHWPGKTITESDNNLFSLLTMNHHPLHIDKEYAKSTQHDEILVVGTLVFSLAVGLTVRDISGKAIANLGYEKISHIEPVFIGDTIYVETEVLEIRDSKTNNDRGILYVESTVFNQKNKIVLTFRRHVLIPKNNGQ